MGSLTVNGGNRIKGELTPGGNKNIALPALAASVLACTGKTLLHNVPDIVDVRSMLLILESLGAQCTFNGSDVEIDASNVNRHEISPELCRKVRTSILFAGPLACRLGKARLGTPGGDPIGRRRLDTHFYGLGKLGLIETGDETTMELTKGANTQGCELFLDEASVTGTEHIMMAAAATEGTTMIRNAACEPHVEQLADLLNTMGANITGAGTNTIVIEGSRELHGGELTLESDHIEVVSYMALCAAVGGSIKITGRISPHNYWMARRVFERFNCRFTVVPDCITMTSPDDLRINPDMNNAIPVISDGPWPQFPSDMMSCFIAMATQAKGTVLFFEKMFESRIYFVDKLIAMGANAIVCDPHRVVIAGPAQLHGITMTSPDIRAGMAMVIAACCAKGTSVINNIEMVQRGYQGLDEKLRSLGMDVSLQ